MKSPAFPQQNVSLNKPLKRYETEGDWRRDNDDD